jgi:hypothetical protein
VRVADKLGEFSMLDDALRRGEVSYSKVRAIARVVTPANETMFLEIARITTASALEKLCRKYSLVQRHCRESTPLDDQQRRYVRRRDTEDGMVKIEAVLHPEEAEMVWMMLDHAATAITRGFADSRSRPAGAQGDHMGQADASAKTTATHGEPAAQVDASAGAAATPGEPARKADASAETAALQGEHVCQHNASTETAAIQGEPAGPADASAGTAALHGEHVCQVEASAETRGALPSTWRPVSVLQLREDATKRAFNRADALVSVAQNYLRGDRLDRSPIDITVSIPASSLHAGEADPVEVGEVGASFVAGAAIRRLCCDAGVIEVIEDEHGTPLSVGRKHRTISGALKRALRKRDTACTFPGCTHRIFLEGHHIKHWADGGETSLMNVSMICSAHHRYVHEYGYTVELGEDQRPRFRVPQGRLVAAAPVPAATGPDLGWPRIRAMNAALTIDANTIACGWDGSPVDYSTIVGQLVTIDGLD